MSDEETELVDAFEQLDAADAVTSDAEDSVGSRVDQDIDEADLDDQEALAHAAREISEEAAGSDIDEDVSRSARERRRAERTARQQKHAAQCRHCRQFFSTSRAAREHGRSCAREPVAVCRFCEQTHTRREDPEQHLYDCQQFRQHKRQRRAHQLRGSDAGTGSFQDYQFIKPWYHEFKAYVKYDLGESISEMDSYFGLVSLAKEHDFESYGPLSAGFDDPEVEWSGPDGDAVDAVRADIEGGHDEIDDWSLEFFEDESGLAPPDSEDWSLEEVREYRIRIYPGAYEGYQEAKEDGRRRCTFMIKPRWPDIESTGGISIPNPYAIHGVDVEVSGTNIPFEHYPTLLQEALRTLQQRQGFRFDSYSSIDPSAFAPSHVHESSNIVDAELYVRVDSDETGTVHAFDGTLNRISMLLSGERSGYTKSVRDDRECPGHYHTATIGSMRADAMIGGHDLPKELKHYLVQHQRAVEGSGAAIEHPKIGVSFQHSLATETVYYDDLERLERELDEALLNVLKWSDIPTRPDHQVFVDDDYFHVEGERRFRKLVHEQLPRLEQQQDQEAQRFAVAGNLTQTDVALVETLLTDGGVQKPAEAAEEIGVALSTIYRSIERLGSMVVHRYGELELGSTYLAQQVLGKLKGAKRAIDQGLEGAVDDLVRGEQFFSDPGEQDPWEAWLAHYVERIDESHGEPDELVLGYEPSDRQEAKRLVRSGAGKWAQVTGRDWHEFAKEFVPKVRTSADGLWTPDWVEFEGLLPKDISIGPTS